MSKLHHYFSMIVFVSAVMVGVQAPNFVDQYVKRVDAHRQEAAINFAGYRAAADQFHNGSVAALIAHYRAQPDPTFQSGAEAIHASQQRLDYFKRESETLEAALWKQVLHVLFSADGDLLKETRNSFSPAVPLNVDALVCGIGAGVLASLLLESVLGLLTLLLFKRSRRRAC